MVVVRERFCLDLVVHVPSSQSYTCSTCSKAVVELMSSSRVSMWDSMEPKYKNKKWCL